MRVGKSQRLQGRRLAAAPVRLRVRMPAAQGTTGRATRKSILQQSRSTLLAELSSGTVPIPLSMAERSDARRLKGSCDMTTQTEKLLTAEEFAEIAARGDVGRCELVEGRLLPLSGAKPRHGRIAGRVFRYIDRHVEEHQLGVVYAAETGYVVARNPDTIKCPDVSFVRAERVTNHDE